MSRFLIVANPEGEIALLGFYCTDVQTASGRILR
jgi:hypothetical protein